MQIDYPDNPLKIKPSKLPNSILLDIGKIVRIFAEIEDCLTAFICNLSGMSMAETCIMLGRMNISGKLIKVEQLISTKNEEDLRVHNAIFNDDFKKCLKARNILVHGRYAGESSDKGKKVHSFVLAEPSETNIGHIMRDTISFDAESIKNICGCRG